MQCGVSERAAAMQQQGSGRVLAFTSELRYQAHRSHTGQFLSNLLPTPFLL